MADLIVFEDDKKALIRQTIAKSLSADQFELFLGIAKARGLDPVLGQIHASVHKDKSGNLIMTPIVGIDGARLVAHRTREYLGRTEAEFTYAGTKPEKVKITVYRLVQGQRAEFTASAKWSEYYPGDHKGFMWNKMPETMLEKVCEMKALRMAFPNDLGGLYSAEEMEQASESREVSQEPQDQFQPKDATPNHDGLIQAFMGLGVSRTDILARYGINDISELEDPMLIELRAIYPAIKSGEASSPDYFKKKGEENEQR